MLATDDKKAGELIMKFFLFLSRLSLFTQLADFKVKKIQQNRAANALFFGVVLGFVFSFLFAYTGVFDETTTIDYSLYEFMSTWVLNHTLSVIIILSGKFIPSGPITPT